MSRRLLLRELLVGCCRGVDGGVKPAVGWASRRIRAALNMVLMLSGLRSYFAC